MMINGDRAGAEHTFKRSLFLVALMDIIEVFYWVVAGKPEEAWSPQEAGAPSPGKGG